MENINSFKILNFIAECNEFIDGKYLFASTKIFSILDLVLQSEELLDLFEQCQEDFNYSLESTKAFIKTPTKPGYFVKPTELDKFLALGYNLLKDFKAEQLNFNVFVSKYFGGEEKLTPHQKFAKDFVLPLKETIAKYFELDEKNKRHFSEEEIEKEGLRINEQTVNEETEISEEPENLEPEQKSEEENFEKTQKAILDDIMREIAQTARIMLTKVKTSLRIKPEVEQDAIFLLSEIISATTENDVEKTYMLLTGFKYMRKHLKVLKSDMLQIIALIYELESI